MDYIYTTASYEQAFELICVFFTVIAVFTSYFSLARI